MASSTNCGKCNGSCTCDNCCTRRGEVYHFARPRFKAESRKAEPRTPRTLPRPLPRPQHNPYEFLNDIIIDPTTYHAILYDLNGAPIARTFFGADGDTKVVVAQPRRRRREFIGDLHESWRSLGPNPVVYVDPPLPGKLKRNGEKKRLYIGDQSVLSLPIRARAPLLSPPFVPLPAMPAEDPVAGVAVAPVDPVTPPARAPDIEVDVHLLNLDSFDVGPPVPATPQTPAPLDIEIDFDPPDPFASPLTSIDSETSGDEADGVLEKTDKSPAVTSAMRAVVLENAGDEDPVVTSPMAAMGFEKAGNEDPTVPSVMAALNDYASSAAGSDDEEPWGPSEAVGEAQGEPTGESGYCLSLDAADRTAVQSPQTQENNNCCDLGPTGGVPSLTGPTTALTNSDMAKAISRALGAIGHHMSIEPSLL
ncbi:hypothetical protein C8R45DRAFT_350801 [Mycena sanguinolenta]|nr:hypothetical protein C8R45DRAFT_350801 [Mycena sanguinolenta]